MDSKQRTKFSATVLRWLQDPEKEQMLRNLLVSPAAIQEEHKSEVETTKRKVSIFWGSTPAWAVIGMIAGVVASQWSLKVLFVVAWGVFFGEFIRVRFFEKRTAKIVGNVLAGIILVFVFYTGWKFTPKPKEVPTLDQQINALAQKFPWLNSRPPTPVVTVNVPPAPTHTHVEYEPAIQSTSALGFPDLRLQLRAQVKPTMVFAFRNSGDFAVERPSDASLVVLVPHAKADTVFHNNQKFLKFFGPSGSIPARSQNGAYHTNEGPPLTEANVSDIKAGNLYLCGIGAVRWSDSTGRYETRYVECLEAEYDHTLNWHIMKENNEESQLN